MCVGASQAHGAVLPHLPALHRAPRYFSARNIVILPEAHCRQGKAGLSHRLLLHREVFSAMAKKKHVSFLWHHTQKKQSITTIKEYSLAALSMLSNPMRHPKSLGHTLKVPMFGKNTQFHFLQWLQVYNLWTSVIMLYFHCWSWKTNFLFLIKSKLKSDLQIFFLLARVCCFPRHVIPYIFSTKLCHRVPTYRGLNFQRFLLFLDYFWADITTLCCKAINLQLLAHSLLLGPLPRASPTTVSPSISSALDFSLK